MNQGTGLFHNNQIMFVGKDVATALGYAKPQNALATHVDREDKSTAPIQGTAYETRESGGWSLFQEPEGLYLF